MKKKRKVNKKNSIFIAFCILILITFDYSASKYGTGTIFNQYNKLQFRFQVKLFDGKYNLWSGNDFPLVYKEAYFPTAGISILDKELRKGVFVKDLLSMSVVVDHLYVLVLDSSMSKHVLKIDSVAKDGVAEDYKIISDSIEVNKLKKENDWVNIQPSMTLHFYIFFWPKLFWLLLIVIILYSVVNIYKWKFNNQI